MGFASAAAALQARFEDLTLGFPFYRPTVPWVVENESRQEPDSGSWPSWARWQVREGETRQVALGIGGVPTRRFRTPGLVIVSIFVPPGSGIMRVREIADDVATIYRDVKIPSDRIICRAPRFEDVGPTGAWYQGLVIAPFFFDLLV